ncbi:hypothetical protein SAMN04515691_0318 [Leifsonia sp. 98AMF]|uniref:hypothetical protein n=1 Tax=unclassified Leifsonia TaxID=2663824 RepID=UPI00087C82DF|nr:MULTISPECIES: hypothetical protein [unclassified Leifsonia]SDH69493.1 hypothetical protein SAMN04515690_3702 [Leifsonia sp. 197AMF]SDI70387.1 hypothetical protein SAMN04515684_0087 [Leifsonia sp. 466MF]SDK20428.1 hypothetical protein SAMN04515683_2664 [Leifsonia sp. 157MF]SDN72772.1 hypothetical protein SAMN04515686_2288 [Leifsonia sp. 509MF]SEN35518.1 hypothetical protein SAMN04515685_2648 [Leifsonia sp. 467MF]
MKTVFAWHRPLMTVAALMIVSTIVCLVGLLVDPRQITGMEAWAKPLKFSLSILLYSVTWAWLIAHLPKWRRIAHAAGTVVAVALIVEQVLIIGAAAAGTTSHFNVSSPLASAVWGVMAISITALYVCTFLTTIAVFFLRLSTRSTTLAVRAGAVIALAGMGLAYLMTGPTAAQLADFRGIAGAHTVGLADGGPGLPVLGWSTVGGDLRIPHFIGMHALQLLPLLAVMLGWLGRRWRPLADDRVRTRLVVVATAAYGAVLALVTVQALAGQSIVRPDGVFLAAGWTITLAALLAAAAILTFRPRPLPSPTVAPA